MTRLKVAEAAAALPSVVPAAGALMMVPLVGRETEIAVVDRLLASAKEGSGGGVLLVGEAGIGKTRLTIELADHARAEGFTVLTAARCLAAGPTGP